MNSSGRYGSGRIVKLAWPNLPDHSSVVPMIEGRSAEGIRAFISCLLIDDMEGCVESGGDGKLAKKGVSIGV